ncbi:MAG TPA: ABC transporter permease [Alphaproteobacteria bacterium]|nr:ABC transporter permease [Alphaproteobacteria bacterium]
METLTAIAGLSEFLMWARDGLAGFADWQIIVDSLPKLFRGLVRTFQLVAISLALGFVVAVPLALLRVSRNPIAWMPVYAYVYVMRGTPLLVQLYLIYYGSGQIPGIQESVFWPFLREPWYCAVLTFTLNTAAYQTEIFRGAILAVPHGEVEAAKSVGMSRSLLLRRIVLPRAFRYALPAFANEVILTLQASAIASIVTIQELTGTAEAIISNTFAFYELYITIALMYLTVTYSLVWMFRRMEHRLSGHLRDRPTIGPLARSPAQPAEAGLR